MKKFLLLPLLFLSSYLHAQRVEGAWKLISQNQVPVSGQEFIKIYQDNYFAFGIKNLADNSFVGAGGGPYAMTSGTLQETYGLAIALRFPYTVTKSAKRAC